MEKKTYDDLSDAEKDVLNDVLGTIQTFISKLDKKDFPEKFWVMDMVKSDNIFGRCIFLNEADMLQFKDAYGKLADSPDWGFALAEIINLPDKEKGH